MFSAVSFLSRFFHVGSSHLIPQTSLSLREKIERLQRQKEKVYWIQEIPKHITPGVPRDLVGSWEGISLRHPWTYHLQRVNGAWGVDISFNRMIAPSANHLGNERIRFLFWCGDAGFLNRQDLVDYCEIIDLMSRDGECEQALQNWFVQSFTTSTNSYTPLKEWLIPTYRVLFRSVEDFFIRIKGIHGEVWGATAGNTGIPTTDRREITLIKDEFRAAYVRRLHLLVDRLSPLQD